MALKLLSLNRTGTVRTTAELKAERFRAIDNLVQIQTPPFPSPARPASALIQGRKLRP